MAVALGLLVPMLASAGPLAPHRSAGPGLAVQAMRDAARASSPAPGVPRAEASSSALNGTWANLSARSPVAPSPRCCTASTWDAASNELLVFGGMGPPPAAASNATWAYAGDAWHLLSTTGSPSARSYAAMAYDPALGAVVLFGGYDTSLESYLNDTWTFSNDTWTEESAAVAPAPRIGESFTYDPSSGALILFGGDRVNSSSFPVSLSPVNDTWSFTARGWSPLSTPTAPSPRAFAQTTTYPPADGVLLFGGTGGSAQFNDTWTFSNGTWTPKPAASAPPPLSAGLAAWDPVGGYAVLTGGTGGTSSGFPTGTWGYLNGSWRSIATSAAPGGRDEAAGGWDPSLGAMVVFGGAVNVLDSPELNDTWAYFDPLALPSGPGPTFGDAGVPVEFSAAPHGGLLPLSWNWSFGDGTNGTGAPIAHAYATPGMYGLTVRARDSSGAEVSASVDVAIVAAPRVAIVSDPVVPDAGVGVLLTANVTGGSAPFAVTWNFSGGPPVTGASVVHVFPTPGLSPVSVSVQDAAGATTAGRLLLEVAQGPLLTLASSVRESEVGQFVAFSAAASGGVAPYSVNWSFGDGSGTVGLGAEHAYNAPGNYSATATLTDASGGTATGVIPIEIVPALGVAEAATPLTTDVGGVVTLLARTTGGVGPWSYEWAFGDGAVASGPGVVHSYAAPGRYGATITVTDARGALASTTEFVNVEAAPTVALSSGVAAAAVGAVVSFHATTQGGSAPFAYAWNFGDGAGASGANVTHTYSGPGAYRVSVAVTDAANVSAVASLVEVVAPAATARAAGIPLSAETGPLVGWGLLATAVFALIVLAHLRADRRTSPARGRRGPPPATAPSSVAAGSDRTSRPPPPLEER